MNRGPHTTVTRSCTGSIRRCAIDSSILGVPVSRIIPPHLGPDELREIIVTAKTQDASLIYWGAGACSSRRQDIVMQDYTGYCCATNISLSVTLRIPPPAGIHDCMLPPVTRFDGTVSTPELDALALECSRHSHLRNDPRISHEHVDLLYSLWMQNSVAGEEADIVLVVRDGARITGMATCAVRSGTAVIGLIAVERQSRRKGLGTLLVRGVQRHAAVRGCRTLSVVTQEKNEPALLLYQRCGFISLHASHMYHFWRT